MTLARLLDKHVYWSLILEDLGAMQDREQDMGSLSRRERRKARRLPLINSHFELISDE